jgi:Flp pilus assembly CpaE family ATPase
MKECNVLLIEDNPGDARLVQEMLADAEAGSFRVQIAESLVAALDALAHGGFDVALVDLSLPDSNGLETLLTVQRHAPSMPIVALTGLKSESMALAAVEKGAQDYLVKGTLTTESLVRALQYAMMRRHSSSGPADAQLAAVVGFLGAKGGVGTTTIACHCALELQRQSKKKVLLIDLDVSAASAAFLMDAHSECTIADAAMNLHRLDSSFWSNLVCSTSPEVDLLQSPGAKRSYEPLDGERVRHVLRFARALYGYIVVDLGRLNGVSLNLTVEVSELFVVTTAEMPSLYEVGYILKKLLDPGITGGRTQLILNRLLKGAMSSTGDFERVLGHPVCAAIGDCSSELQEAYGSRRFLDERLPLRKPVRQLVAKLLGVAEEPKAPTRTGRGFFGFARS